MELNHILSMKTKYDHPIIQFGIITIFPEMFHAITNYGITKKAINQNIITVDLINPRNFSKNRYKSIDNRPYGGGPGMLMSAEPLYLSIQYAQSILPQGTIIYLTPQGKLFEQNHIKQFINKQKIIFICGRYEGIDQRIIDHYVHEEWSIGNYIITGGELAAMIIIDSMSRLTPGVIKKTQSIEEETFSNNLFDYPNYTRPKIVQNISVPKILLSGNHNEIRLWRLMESLKKTWINRPDLLKKKLTKEEKILLDQVKNKLKNNN